MSAIMNDPPVVLYILISLPGKHLPLKKSKLFFKTLA